MCCSTQSWKRRRLSADGPRAGQDRTICGTTTAEDQSISENSMKRLLPLIVLPLFAACAGIAPVQLDENGVPIPPPPPPLPPQVQAAMPDGMPRDFVFEAANGCWATRLRPTRRRLIRSNASGGDHSHLWGVGGLPAPNCPAGVCPDRWDCAVDG